MHVNRTNALKAMACAIELNVDTNLIAQMARAAISHALQYNMQRTLLCSTFYFTKIAAIFYLMHEYFKIYLPIKYWNSIVSVYNKLLWFSTIHRQ